MAFDEMSRPVYCNGRVHVLGDLCSTCIFRPGNLMRLPAGRVAGMVKDSRAEAGGSITCHSTLYGERDQEAICRGWWDRYADESITLRLAMTMGIVEYVDPN